MTFGIGVGLSMLPLYTTNITILCKSHTTGRSLGVRRVVHIDYESILLPLLVGNVQSQILWLYRHLSDVTIGIIRSLSRQIYRASSGLRTHISKPYNFDRIAMTRPQHKESLEPETWRW